METAANRTTSYEVSGVVIELVSLLC